MFTAKPVTISKGGFRFCRYSMAVLLWAAFFLRMPALVIIGAGAMALSALLTIRYAPLVWLYTQTVDRLFPSPPEILDEHAMRFAHLVATLALCLPLALFYFAQYEIGWRVLGFVAVFKTAGALGYCPVSRMFTCLIGRGGACCGFLGGKGKAC